MSTEFSDMQDLITTKMHEDVDEVALKDAINSAIDALWKKLCEFNPELYLAQQPDPLVLDADIIPFEDLGPDDFIKFSAMAELYDDIYEYDSAEKYGNKAEGELYSIMNLMLQKMERQDSITPHTPREYTAGSVQWSED